MHHNLLHIDFLKKICQEIRKEKINKIAVEEKLNFVLQYYDVINFNCTKKNGLFFRARKLESNDSYDHVRELGAPPIHLTRANRLNAALDPVYYLAHNMLCAFDEIRTNVGERVQVIVYEPNEKIIPRFAIIGEKKNVFRRGHSKYSEELGTYIKKNTSLTFSKGSSCFSKLYIFR